MNRFHLILSGIAALTLAGGVAIWMNSGKSPEPSASARPGSPIPDSKPLPLHPVVGRIIREGAEMPYLKFNYLIKELPTDLAAHDIEALIAFIMAPPPAAFLDAEWGSLVNDIQECLTVQTIPSESVARALSAIYRDESRIQLQRDYALQHIGGFAIFLIHTRSADLNSQSPISKIQSLLLADLRHAVSDPTNPWAGTALNLLDGILRAAESRTVEIPGLDAQSLSALALPIAENPGLPLNSRLPALQLMGRHRAPQAAELARRILSDSSSSLMLVQAAAGVLSQCGTRDDLPLLQTALATGTVHTRPALAHAIRTLSVP